MNESNGDVGRRESGLDSMLPVLPETQPEPVQEGETALVSHKYVTKRQALREAESLSA